MAVHQPEWRESDTLVPARYLIALVNQNASFVYAARLVGFNPKGAYAEVSKACQHYRLEDAVNHWARCCDFVASIMEDKPWYFFTDKAGNYSDVEHIVKGRSLGMLLSMGRRGPGKTLFVEKYAGPKYFERWGESK